MLGGLELNSEGTPSPVVRASLSAFFCCSSWVNCSTGRASSIFSVTVGNNARTVKVQSVWFCSNLRCKLESARQLFARVSSSDNVRGTYFSFAMRSKLDRSRASDILLTTYCPTRYVVPTAPAAIAMPLRFRFSQRRVADIIMGGERNRLLRYRRGL